MNRILKFRAWNKRLGWQNPDKTKCQPVMEYDHFVIYPSTGLCEIPQGGWDLSGYTEVPDNFILMQFTGLHDKNGKEIYEGDVVEINDENDTYIREVKWEKGGYTFDIWEDFAPLISDEALTLEVIGNRFEHSHLLEVREKSTKASKNEEDAKKRFLKDLWFGGS
jgi:uncharacterized phage protein (TIGR01671 family)